MKPVPRPKKPDDEIESDEEDEPNEDNEIDGVFPG